VTVAWPGAGLSAAQVDYETLRAAVLAGTPLTGPAARRFAAGGLAGLIRRPATATPRFAASVIGAARPPWCGGDDPRLAALTAGYQLLVAAGDTQTHELEEVAR
jgi:hypothetical protein